MRSDMMRLPRSLCCNLSFVASLRTSIPERRALVQNGRHKQKAIHWSTPNSMGPPFLFTKNDFSKSTCLRHLVSGNLVVTATHIFLTEKEDWPGPINGCSLRLQSVDRVRPVAFYEFNNRTRTIHDTTVRTVVQNQFKSSWFDGGEARLA